MWLLLYGGSGNDLMDGGTGSDTMIGGAGDDTYYVDNVGDVIDDQGLVSDNDTIILMEGIRGTYKLGKGIEDLTGSIRNDRISGNQWDNVINGDDGDDKLKGGSGEDELIGGSGADVLIGGKGVDELIGGAGSDVLIGGKGVDELTGGKGSDEFVLKKGAGHAIVTDYQSIDDLVIKGKVKHLDTDFKKGDTYIFFKTDLIGIIEDAQITI